MMLSLSAPFLLLATALPASSDDARGNRIEPLPQLAEDGQTACAGAWCVSITPSDDGAPSLRVADSGGGAAGAKSAELPALAEAGGFGGVSRSVWPMRVVLGAGPDAAYLAGVLDEERTMYSGGGAHRVQLTLYRFAAGQPARAVLSVPWQAGAMIRACFSERDMRQRAGACHDEYAFVATLAVVPGAVVPGGSAGAPVLRYATRATSYPGKVSRSADSLAAKPLRRRDLVTAVDADCSFTRDFRLDPASGTWRPDSPLPDCDDFTGL